MDVVTAYHELPGFEHLYLEDSYVLGIEHGASFIRFEMLFVLLESSPFFEHPKPEEQYCDQEGRIIFENIREIVRLERANASYTDKSGEIDFGNIDAFTMRGNVASLEGDWGELVVVSDMPRVEYFATKPN